MPTHRIRLIGPWEYVWTATAEDSTGSVPDGPAPASSGTVKMPCDWRTLFGNTSGSAAFTRRFHRPTNLEPHERVFIVFEGIGGDGHISLNDEVVSSFQHSGQPMECDVTHRLQRFNHLDVSLTFAPSNDTAGQGGLYGAVVLEIRS